jgi:hypothetical protein
MKVVTGKWRLITFLGLDVLDIKFNTLRRWKNI